MKDIIEKLKKYSGVIVIIFLVFPFALLYFYPEAGAVVKKIYYNGIILVFFGLMLAIMFSNFELPFYKKIKEKIIKKGQTAPGSKKWLTYLIAVLVVAFFFWAIYAGISSQNIGLTTQR